VEDFHSLYESMSRPKERKEEEFMKFAPTLALAGAAAFALVGTAAVAQRSANNSALRMKTGAGYPSRAHTPASERPVGP
jgi:hypothetical protein